MHRTRPISRRALLRGAATAALLPALPRLAAREPNAVVGKPPLRSVIMLWLAGGPSQYESFTPIAGQTFKEVKLIDTALPGTRFCEFVPLLAQRARDLAVIQSMTSLAPGDDHEFGLLDSLRTTDLDAKGDALKRRPNFLALFARERVKGKLGVLPSMVVCKPKWSPGEQDGNATVVPNGGYLGAKWDPLYLGTPQPGGLRELARTLESMEFEQRLALLRDQDAGLANSEASPYRAHLAMREQTLTAMSSPDAKAFDIYLEPESVRKSYGCDPKTGFKGHFFSDGCLLARRLVEIGVPSIHVSFPGWDSHGDTINIMRSRGPALDRAVSALIDDLKQRGLFETTAIILKGEMGRLPSREKELKEGSTQPYGRGHNTKFYTAVVAGGGLKLGQVVGTLNETGDKILDRKITTADIYATLCQRSGIDLARTYNMQNGLPVGEGDDSKGLTPISLLPSHASVVPALLG